MQEFGAENVFYVKLRDYARENNLTSEQIINLVRGYMSHEGLFGIFTAHMGTTKYAFDFPDRESVIYNKEFVPIDNSNLRFFINSGCLSGNYEHNDPISVYQLYHGSTLGVLAATGLGGGATEEGLKILFSTVRKQKDLTLGMKKYFSDGSAPYCKGGYLGNDDGMLACQASIVLFGDPSFLQPMSVTQDPQQQDPNQGETEDTDPNQGGGEQRVIPPADCGRESFWTYWDPGAQSCTCTNANNVPAGQEEYYAISGITDIISCEGGVTQGQGNTQDPNQNQGQPQDPNQGNTQDPPTGEGSQINTGCAPSLNYNVPQKLDHMLR